MKNKAKVLILNFKQFGYHIDSWMYAKYANKEVFDIHYFCFDLNLEKINCNDITIKYIPLTSNRVSSYLRLFSELRRYIKYEKFNLIFHINVKFTFLIRLINLRSPMVLDIRTGDLSDSDIKRFIKNTSIWISSLFYPKISIITESLREELRIKTNKVTVIPLGGEYQKFAEKDFNDLRLLYVGTLDKRNIEQTIEGLILFFSRFPTAKISYDIIGFGSRGTVKKVEDLIKNSGFSDRIVFHGRKKHSDVIPYLEKCNVGIVYVPCTKYYQFQPSTKFFEYVLAGMPVIATDTYENRSVLEEGCGYLCKDNPGSFAETLEKMFKERNGFNSDRINSMYLPSQWSVIVEEIWEPFILKNCKKRLSV